MVDREDFEGLGFQESLFYRKWIPGEPEAVACDYADVPAPGPFLIRANDEDVWLSHDGESWIHIAKNTRYSGSEQRRWSHLARLYTASVGLSPRSLINRLRSVRVRLSRNPGRWARWSSVYKWDEGSDLIWSGLIYHPRLETRMNGDTKEVRYVGKQRPTRVRR